MKLNIKDVEELRSILAACKVIGVEGVVIHEGMVRGAKPSLDAAIISVVGLSIPENLKMGIGRVSELDKRLSIFNGRSDISIEVKHNDSGDVSLLVITAGKTKLQFRCTSPSIMRYPKSNDDAPFVVIMITRAEATQISKAVKTLGAEHITVYIDRGGNARLECADSANDKFEIELSEQVKYQDDEGSLVQSYLAAGFVDVIDSAAKEVEIVELVVGTVGSVTVQTKGHTVLLMPQIIGEE